MKNVQLTQEFEIYFSTLAKENWGTWPSASDWPKCEIPYTATQVSEGNEVHTIVKFDTAVKNSEGFEAKRFRAYPISNRKPNGAFNSLR